MKAKATIRLRFSSEKQLSALLRALAPEANRPINVRGATVLERQGLFLALKIEAKDTIALRATLNAYLRWVSSIINVLKIAQSS
jgi:tRNA threonylcarbamoyladenosine modification (KEOPS) complex  Pcc1 subunit